MDKETEEKFNVKSDVLKSLGTKEITEKIVTRENELEKLLKAEAKFKAENAGYLASVGSDCATVKQMLTELSVQAPFAESGKKATVAERDAWLVRQRTENRPLAEAIAHQADVAWKLEEMRVDIEMAKKRYESLRQVLSLKIAQIEFLTER